MCGGSQNELCIRTCLCSHGVHGKQVCGQTRGSEHVCLNLVHVLVSVCPPVICALSEVRVCQCVLAEDQILYRQQQDPQFWCQVIQCPLIPHNPPCLQAGDPCVSSCLCVCLCLCAEPCTGDISKLRLLSQCFGNSFSHQPVTPHSNQ